MTAQPIMLKVLLGQRHWQNYATFCAEYDKAARKLDAALAGTFPSRPQLHRWTSGALRGLPLSLVTSPRLAGSRLPDLERCCQRR
jgi:hypothetical protein